MDAENIVPHRDSIPGPSSPEQNFSALIWAKYWTLTTPGEIRGKQLKGWHTCFEFGEACLEYIRGDHVSLLISRYCGFWCPVHNYVLLYSSSSNSRTAKHCRRLAVGLRHLYDNGPLAFLWGGSRDSLAQTAITDILNRLN